jgi:lipid-binding SYLF domain-containing protein
MMNRSTQRWSSAVAGALMLVVFAMPSAASGADLVAEARDAIAALQKVDPGIDRFFKSAPGYVVFPTVSKGAVLVGGAGGAGVLFENGKAIGKASLAQVTIGAQLGGQSYSEIIFFETMAAVDDFKKGNLAFAAQVSAVALSAGASKNAKYQKGVAVFTASKTGLMSEASVGGQKFSYEAFPSQLH